MTALLACSHSCLVVAGGADADGAQRLAVAYPRLTAQAASHLAYDTGQVDAPLDLLFVGRELAARRDIAQVHAVDSPRLGRGA